MTEENERKKFLLSASSGRLMVSLSLPAIVGMVVIGLYTFVDAIYAGQLISTDAMGAVSIAYPFTFINTGIACLIGMGSASVLSRAIGAGNQDVIDGVMGNLIAMNLILSIAVTVLGVLFAQPLLALTGAEGPMLDLATAYLRVIFCGSLFVNFAQSSNMVMRGEGDMVRAMLIMGGGAVLNMILSPIFILSLRDAGFGLEGAAAATVLSQFVQGAVMLWWFAKKEKVARIHRIALNRDVLPEVLKVGVSAMLMQVLTLVQQAVIYRAAAYWGGAEWQVFGAALRIQAFSFIPLWGMSNGLQPAIGTNYGAGDYARVKRIMAAFCLGATALCFVFWIPAMLAPEVLLSWFITDPSLVAMGVDNFRLFFAPFFLYGIMIMAITFLQSVGEGGKAAVLTMARPLVLFVPMVLLVPMVTGSGIQGVWLACVLTDLLVLLVAAAMVLTSVKNMRQKIRTS